MWINHLEYVHFTAPLHHCGNAVPLVKLLLVFWIQKGSSYSKFIYHLVLLCSQLFCRLIEPVAWGYVYSSGLHLPECSPCTCIGQLYPEQITSQSQGWYLDTDNHSHVNSPASNSVSPNLACFWLVCGTRLSRSTMNTFCFPLNCPVWHLFYFFTIFWILVIRAGEIGY